MVQRAVSSCYPTLVIHARTPHAYLPADSSDSLIMAVHLFSALVKTKQTSPEIPPSQTYYDLHASHLGRLISRKRTKTVSLLQSASRVRALLRFGWGCSSVGYSIGPSRRWRRFDSPARQGIFLQESTFSEDLRNSRVQSHAFTSVHTLKIL